MTTNPLMMATLIATDNPDQATGAIVYWSLSGDIQYDDLKTCWANAGLPEKELPSPVTPAVARWRACVAQSKATIESYMVAVPSEDEALDGVLPAMRRVTQKVRILARPLAKKGDCALVREVAIAGEPLTHTTIATLLSSEGAPNKTAIQCDDAALTAKLRAEMDRQAGLLTTDDVSVWLTNRVVALKALAIRPNGGTYFLPRMALEAWRDRVTAVRSASKHKGYEIPAMKTAEAVEAILDALAREAEAEAEGMENELLDGDLSARSMRNRVARLEAVTEKVMTYEALLDTKAATLTERLDRLRGNLSAAILAAGAEAT